MSRSRHARLAAIAAFVGLVWVWSGCSTTPAPTQSSDQNSNVTIIHRGMGKIASSYVDTTFLATVAKGSNGTITIGNDVEGYSSVTIPPGALDQDTEITMSVPTSGDVGMSFSPDIPDFNGKDVVVTVSYKGADLTGVTESSLSLFYNPSPNHYSLQRSYAIPWQKVVVGHLEHFSQYAVGDPH